MLSLHAGSESEEGVGSKGNDSGIDDTAPTQSKYSGAAAAATAGAAIDAVPPTVADAQPPPAAAAAPLAKPEAMPPP